MGKVFTVHPIDLKPGVTEADLEAYGRDAQYSVPGHTIYVAKGDRGARTGQYVVIVEFESAEVRDRYFPSADTTSDEYNQLAAPFMAELQRFGELTTWPSPDFTDYHVIGQSK